MQYPVKGEPKDHQVRALQEAGLKAGHCYWVDPGGGKTFINIAEAGMLKELDRIDGALIVAPKGPHMQWIEEQFPQWADYGWHGSHHNLTPKKLEAYFRVKRPGLAVGAVNYHALNFAKGRAYVEKFISMYPRFLLIIDESQRIKDPKSKWSKVVKEISKQATYVRALSGTPLLNGIEDLFWQYHCVKERDITGFGSFTAFKNHYCIQRPIPGARSRWAQMIVGYRNEDELKERSAPYVTRILSDEFQKDTNPTMSREYIMMEDRDWLRAYNEMEEQLTLTLGQVEVEMDNALGALQKLQQIACGFVYDEDGDAYWFNTERVERVTELVQGLSEPVILWSPYKALTEALRGSLHKVDRPVFGQMNVDQWKDSPNGVLLGHQGSGLGVGMNLQHAAAAIYAGNTYSREQRVQSMRRIDRMGQERQVRFWDFMAPGTVEPKILQALQEKEALSIRNVDALRELIRS